MLLDGPVYSQIGKDNNIEYVTMVKTPKTCIKVAKDILLEDLKEEIANVMFDLNIDKTGDIFFSSPSVASFTMEKLISNSQINVIFSKKSVRIFLSVVKDLSLFSMMLMNHLKSLSQFLCHHNYL